MTKHKHQSSVLKGFTIIEVTLVLAISMFLFIGLIGGTTVNITRQRYNDSVQNFAEFLRRQYSEVISTENPRDDDIDSEAPCTATSAYQAGNASLSSLVQTGRSDCAIYGKLITFGEDSDNPHKVFTYDVVGDDISAEILSSDDSSLLKYTSSEVPSDIGRALANVSAGVVTLRRTAEDGRCRLTPAGNESEYEFEWNAYAARAVDYYREDIDPNSPITGTLLIVRSPLSGVVTTVYFLETVIPVQELFSVFNDQNSLSYGDCYSSAFQSYFGNYSLEHFLINPDIYPYGTAYSTGYVAEFCINSDDFLALEGGRRRMVGIDNDGKNASAVRVFNQDSEENRCRS